MKFSIIIRYKVIKFIFNFRFAIHRKFYFFLSNLQDDFNTRGQLVFTFFSNNMWSSGLWNFIYWCLKYLKLWTIFNMLCQSLSFLTLDFLHHFSHLYLVFSPDVSICQLSISLPLVPLLTNNILTFICRYSIDPLFNHL